MKRDSIDGVLKSLRRVNLQGSFFGQTVAIRFGLSESDIDQLTREGIIGTEMLMEEQLMKEKKRAAG